MAGPVIWGSEGGMPGLTVGLGCGFANIAQGSRQGGDGAVATSNPTGVAWNGHLWTNIVLLFCENKIGFSCVKI